MGIVLHPTDVLRDVVFDEAGHFVSGVHVDRLSAEGTFTLSLRLSGDPGSYWLVVKTETPVPTHQVQFPSQFITLKGGHFDLFTELPSFHNAPPGAYTFNVWVANEWLGSLTVPVSENYGPQS